MTSLNGKECRHCCEQKSYEDFHDNKEMRDGKSSYCKPCASERSRLWKQKNKDHARDTYLRKTYGISLTEHLEMFTSQGGKCAICGIEEHHAPRATLFVDHDHDTGLVRGLLCHHCNSGLGHFMDNREWLSQAITYLEKGEAT